MQSSISIVFGMAGAIALVGCASTRPDLPDAPPQFAAAVSGESAAQEPSSGWLEAWQTPELTTLAREAIVANPELAAAEARSQASRARARGAFGRILPTLGISSDLTRTETPGPGNATLTTDIVSAAASASWEADIWGRVSALAAAADRDADASDADFEGARLSITGRTARAWIDLIEAQQLEALAAEDLATRERALTITQRRYERGLLTALSVRTARSQTASARASASQAQEALNAASRRLQVLLGRYPDAELRATGAAPALAELHATGAPQTLLDRRPDVLAAQARLESAGFRLHEARASLLPRLTLSARAFGDGGQLAQAIDPDTLVNQLIAGLTAPLFQGGSLRQEVRASAAEVRGAAANYVSTTLDAWSEVETAITADASLAVREAELATAAQEAAQAQELAEREYERGVATIFELIDAYSRRIDAQRGLIATRAARVSNRITYHVALGEPGFVTTPAEGAGP
jgi:NodT family efflux transporter outer membrane factor (OMF) lipoprotein